MSRCPKVLWHILLVAKDPVMSIHIRYCIYWKVCFDWKMQMQTTPAAYFNTMDGFVCLEQHVRPHSKKGAAAFYILAHALSVSRGKPSPCSLSKAGCSLRIVTSSVDQLAMKLWQWIWQVEHPVNSFPLQIKIVCMSDEQLLPNDCNWPPLVLPETQWQP